MDAKQAAQQELLRRKAVAELERRKASQQSGLQDHEKMSASENFVGQGMLMGFGDELTAAIGTPGRMVKQYMNDQPVSMSQAYEDGHDFEQERIRQYKEESPIASTASEIGGSMFGAGNLMKGGVSLLAKNPTVLKAAAEGGIYGGIYGAGTADRGERTEGAAIGAGTGAAFGGLAQGGANAIKSKLANRAAQKAAPAIDDLKQKSQALYTKMRESGVVVREAKINNIKGNIALELSQTSPDLAPQAHALKKLVDDTFAGDVNIIDLHNISKSINRVSRGGLQGEDAHFVGKIKTYVDNAIDNMQAADIKGPLNAVKLKNEADELWKTARKSEIIDGIFEKAQNQATGFENGLVIQFRSLANNKKLMRQFSEAEQKMIKDLVRRGSAREILKGIGMLSPTSTFGGLVTGGVGVGSGILPAAGMAAIGHGSRKAGEAITRGKADAIRQAVLTGNAPIQSVSKSARYSIPTLAQQSTNQTMSANSNKRYQPSPQLKRPQR
jgi:hypothetical protein